MINGLMRRKQGHTLIQLILFLALGLGVLVGAQNNVIVWLQHHHRQTQRTQSLQDLMWLEGHLTHALHQVGRLPEHPVHSEFPIHMKAHGFSWCHCTPRTLLIHQVMPAWQPLDGTEPRWRVAPLAQHGGNSVWVLVRDPFHAHLMRATVEGDQREFLMAQRPLTGTWQDPEGTWLRSVRYVWGDQGLQRAVGQAGRLHRVGAALPEARWICEADTQRLGVVWQGGELRLPWPASGCVCAS